MRNRMQHNTQALQKNFPEIYRGFFAKCQKVASAPNSFLWAGEFSGFYADGLLINQKLPFRVYVGFESVSHREIRIDSQYLTYEPLNNQFVTKVLDEQLAENWRVFLSDHFGKQKDFNGLNVHILTEAPIGHGLGSNGALSAALAILISPSNHKEKRFKIAREILSLSQRGFSSGVSAYSAFTDSNEPILYFSKGQHFTAHFISDILGNKEPLVWPLDFGLIYSGVQTNSRSVAIAAEHTLTELDKASQKISELLQDYDHPPFRKTFIDMLNMTTSLMANGFVKLFAHGQKDEDVSSFFDAINQYQNLLHILNLSTKNADLIYHQIHALANKESNGIGSGVKVSGIGKGGAMLFALPFGHHRNNITETVNELSQRAGREIWLDYASWLDGIGGEAGRVEQNLESAVIHFFLDHDALLLDLYYHGQKSSRLIANERYHDLAKEVDLMLDKTTGKILITGNALTSKELPSQKAAVKILGKLLAQKDLCLLSDEIDGSYGLNRYDLHSKIVLPLVKQVKEIANKDLQLSISGGTYNNYKLTINPTNISIGLLDKKI